MKNCRVVIVNPALIDANNGNGQTARRWQSLLSPHFSRIVQKWPDSLAEQDDVMLALHARRSAESVSAWHSKHGERGLGVVLTGTDLYRDVAQCAEARESLAMARSLVVLQDMGLKVLPAEHRGKARVIFQSTGLRKTLPKTTRRLNVVMVGHLREEKDPLTLMSAARLLSSDQEIRIDHIGAALDRTLGQAAQETQKSCPHYRWLGELSHRAALQRIQRAHLLVHASRMEGGAHVVMEALRSGTPVLVSRIDGNLGLLGEGYEGVFDVGDARGLVDLLQACRKEQIGDGLLARLKEQCARRAPLFEPGTEQAALHRWVQDLWKY